MRRLNALKFGVLSLFMIVLSIPVTAQATIIFDSWTTNEGESGNYSLSITKNVDGELDFVLDVNPFNVDTLAIFLDMGDFDITNGVLESSDPTGYVTMTTDTSSNSCGSGCNLNGLSPPIAAPDGQWEFVFVLGIQGSSNLQSPPISWTVSADNELNENFVLAGARGQSLCVAGETLPNGNCGDSDKSYSSTPVPLPGTLALLGIGLISLNFAGRRNARLKA